MLLRRTQHPYIRLPNDDAERDARQERRRKSTARLVGALAILATLSLLRLEPGAIRRSLHEMGRRALDCMIGNVTIPEDYVGYWETNYDPIIDYESPRPVLDPPPADVGYVVPIPNCPEAFVEGQTDPGRAFFDSMAMLKLNVNQAHEAGGDVYSKNFYAVHPDGVTCDGPDGTQYDRVAVLEELKFWVKIWGENVNTTAVQDPAVEDALFYDNLNDLATLNAFTLDEVDLAVIMEPTTQMLEPPNDLFDQMLADPDVQVMLTPSPPPAGSPTPAPGTPDPVSTDFVVIKPNQTTFDAIQESIQNSDYNPETGWNGGGVTDLGTGGILAMHYADSDAAITLDPCTYGDSINDPACSENFTAMNVATLPDCPEPWNCDYDPNTMPAICGEAISQWHEMRADFEDGCLNSPVSVSNGTLDTDVFHGHCVDNGGGFDSYLQMLPDNAVCFGEMQTIEDTKNLPNVDQTQTFSLVTQLYTGNGNSCVQGTVTIPTYVPPFNIAIVIDVSGSTGGNFGGSPVGDLNNHAGANTILDAEIDSVIKMIQSIVDSSNLSNDNVDIELIRFSATARSLGHWPPADVNDPTAINPQLYNRLVGMVDGGITNFDDALDRVVEYFDNSAPFPTGSNLLFFLSDGKPNVCGDDDNEACTANSYQGNNDPDAINYASELALLDTLNVHREAIGVGSGSDITSGSGLEMIDSNSAPAKVLSSDALVNVLTANPVQGIVTALEVTLNGVPVPGIDVNDVLTGPTGFSYGPVTLSGLDKAYGATNLVVSTLTMDTDGDGIGDAVFTAQATTTGTITNLAMSSRRRLSIESNSESKANREMCSILKRRGKAW